MSGYSVEGGCTCHAVRYRLVCPPLFVHCCHCHWCQRETGSAFVINALIEGCYVERLGDRPMIDRIPSASGRGQQVARCACCKTAVWSHYSLGEALYFIRVGTIDEPDLLPPDAHIFVASKQKWLSLTDRKPVCLDFYDREELWPEESLRRFEALTASEGV